MGRKERKIRKEGERIKDIKKAKAVSGRNRQGCEIGVSARVLRGLKEGRMKMVKLQT